MADPNLALVERPAVLTVEQCDELIADFGQALERSCVFRGAAWSTSRAVAPSRTSSSCKIGHAPPSALLQLVAELTGLPVAHQEPWEIIRYRERERFAAHHDWIADRPAAHGGARLFSVIVYLRAPLSGGETNFPLARRRIVPKAGKLVLWNNTVDQRSALPSARHASLPVTAGEKWSLVSWVCAQPLPGSPPQQ